MSRHIPPCGVVNGTRATNDLFAGFCQVGAVPRNLFKVLRVHHPEKTVVGFLFLLLNPPKILFRVLSVEREFLPLEPCRQYQHHRQKRLQHQED